MKENWSSSTLAEVCEIKPPKGEVKRTLTDSDNVSFVPMDQLGICAKAIDVKGTKPLGAVYKNYTYFAENDVLLAKITPCFENGKLGIARGLENGVGFGSSEFIVFRCGETIDPDYLFYFLSRDCFRDAGAKVMAGAVGHKRVPKDFIERHKIPLPPPSEQKRIVAILNEAFKGIDRAIANTEKNLANARELFVNELSAVFSQKCADWVTAAVGDVCSLRSGTTVPKTIEKPTGDIPYVKVSDMSFPGNETAIHSSSRFLQKDDISDKAIFPIGTVIFPKRGGAIATNKKRLTAIKIAADLNVMGVIPSPNIKSEFLYYFFQQFDLASIGSGSSIPQINNYDISPLKIAFPKSKKQQQAIIQKFSDLDQASLALHNLFLNKRQALNSLKQSILQKSFAGELTSKPDRVLAEIGA